MIKCSNNALLSKITTLFNLILDPGYYPEHGIMDLFIQDMKMVLKWTLQIIEEPLY